MSRGPRSGSAASIIAIAGALSLAAGGEEKDATAPTPEMMASGRRAFATVAKVLQSPRCQNCHPSGDRPLQGDGGRLHRFGVGRHASDAGLECNACHRDRNSEALGVKGGPPGAPHWGLPPAETPMVFQGRTVRALCEQLKDRGSTKGRDLPALLDHVSHDALVLWAWDPGGRRTKPPVSHSQFVEAFRVWVASGGACP